MNIGQAIRTLRKQKGLSQGELSGAAGITQMAISQIETGAKRPGDGTLHKICTVLETAVIDIYILAMEESDFPRSKRTKYKLIYPTIRGMILELTK